MSLRDQFAIVLGASSGFGEAISLRLAEAGMHIVGVHLDRRSTLGHVEEIKEKIAAMGREAWFFNLNAADEVKRRSTLDAVAEKIAARGRGETVKVLVHSLAFGSLRGLVPPRETPDDALTRMQLEMTLDVMAHSFAYWVQDALRRDMLTDHGRVYAMTSTGSRAGWPAYGAVSAAKAALEAYVRQFAVEGAARGFTANALCAGVTRTPALDKIPNSEALAARALAKHPAGRLTVPDDVARAVVALASEHTDWLNGNVLFIDGGEAAAG
ncbi:MAG: SDR family oxidoreductase [Myxococcales bacterium]|nr:SDR family oxidoreductase [Myxococcales bacterium]